MQVQPWDMRVEHASKVIPASADAARHDAFPGALTNKDEEGSGLGTVLEELRLSNALLPIPTANASGTPKAANVLHKVDRSSSGTADSRRTTQVQQQSTRYRMCSSFVM